MEIRKAGYDYRKRQRKSRTKTLWLSIFLLAVLIFSGGGYTYAAFSKDIPALTVSAPIVIEKPAETVQLAWPASGQAAIGSAADGALASTNNPQAKPIASMTKVITVLTYLHHNPLESGSQGETVVFTSQDATSYNSYIAKNGSVVPVSAGQSMSEYQIIQAVLLASANNLADTLAIRQFGSVESYIVAANELMRSYGLTQTIVNDASGFSPQTVSTASEMITVATKALANPVIAEVVAQKQAIMPSGITINNTNRLLSDASVVGIKTGTTDEAGYCLLFASTYNIDEQHEVTIIGVVMGDNSSAKLFADARALLDSAKAGFGKIELAPSGTNIATISSIWGQGANLSTESALHTYGWKGKSHQADIEINNAKTPIITGQDMGLAFEKSNPSNKVLIKTDSAIMAPSVSWRLANVF